MLGEDAKVNLMGVGPNSFVDGLDRVVNIVVIIDHLFEVIGHIVELVLTISH